MNKKLGRNDPCPCGSGKKYKHCHMGQAAEEHESGLPFPTVAETFALGPLLAASAPFRATYHAERSKLGTQLVWATNLPMPTEVAAQAIRLPSSGAQVMYLRHVPAETRHATEIAHELLHFVLDAEGFPVLVAQPEHTSLAALLNSLVQDPLISARLQHYGFDIETKIQRDLAVALASLKQAAPPHDAATRRIWALNYAGQLLDCMVVTSAAANQQRETLQGWFRTHHPAVANEGEHVVLKARALGYDTPERMRDFFAWAVEHYNLELVASVALH